MVSGVSQFISAIPETMDWTLILVYWYFLLFLLVTPFPTTPLGVHINGIVSITIHISYPEIQISDPENYGFGNNISSFYYFYMPSLPTRVLKWYQQSHKLSQ